MAAVKSFYWAHADMHKAVEVLLDLVEEGMPANPKDFIRTWVEHFEATGGHVDAPRSGRPHKVPFEEAHHCALVLAAGIEEGGVLHHHYPTIRDAINADPCFHVDALPLMW